MHITSNALGIFISTRRRVEIEGETKNWYADSEDVRNLYENNLLMYAPDFGGIHFEDSFQRYLLNNGNLSDIFTNNTQLVTCYYQCSDDNIRSHVKWFHNNWTDYDLRLSISAQNLMFYRDVGNITGVMPEYVKSSYSGNSQFTVLRNDVEGETQFHNSPTLIVNHEDYVDHQEHEHSDQTSFILYYKARQLLIDPGYLPTSGNYYIAKEWLASPFAHNLIMVNPEWNDITHNEKDEFFHDYSDSLISDVWNGPSYNEYDFNYRDFEPVGRTWEYSQHGYEEIPSANFPPYNPSQRNYIIENENIEHLQVEVTYDHPQLEYGGEYNGNPDDIITVKRNFYFVDKNLENPYFIIYDEISSSDTSSSNTFMNQLHFAVHPDEYNTNYPWEDDLQPNQQNGRFYFDTAEDVTSAFPNPAKIYLHGAMGSQDDFQIVKKDSLPQGLFLGKEWDNLVPPQWEHKALRINTTTEGDEKFLTLLIPSEDSPTPIAEISPEGDAYAVKFSLETGYNIYAAVSDASSVFLDNGDTRFVTDASFFLVEVNEDFIDFKKMIINSDDFLEIRDASGTRFDDIILFESYDGDYEEVSASYEGDVCYISLIPEQGNTPRCKIWRNNCMTLDDEYLATHDFIVYDDNYFYIDYEGNFPPNVTIVGIFHGDLIVNDIMVIENSIFEDDLTISVSEGAFLSFLGHNRFGENTKIEINGTLYIQGSTLTSNRDSWHGIKCYEGSEVWIENEACIEKAETGIFCESGEVHISNSEINLCQRGIMIYNNSSLDFTSSDILIPADIDARGIVIVNSISECNINVSGTAVDSVYIQGESDNQIGKGILLQSYTDIEENSFICNYTEFKNLDVGIQHLPYCRTDHEIENCKFENCDIGIQLLGTGSLSKIEDCDFIGNNNFGCGVNQNTVKTKINNCRFDDNYIGIDYANSQQGPQLSTGVFNSYFGYNQSVNVIDLRCSDTSPEVENCIFKSTIGILSVNNSNVNASFDANNVFLNTDAHLMFAPDSPSFSSGILLHRGHNDFYDENDDFIFLSNYNGSEITIDADGNWWEDFDVDINDEAAIAPPMIIAERKDPEPNVPFFINPGNRFESASQEESLGNNETALNSFKEILNDKLENEKIYWGICIDKVFNLSIILEEDINVLLNFYEVLYQSPPEYLSEEEKSSLQTILKNYQKKCHIEQHEYQEAADIVVERINNPISSVDSLFAVMQLETIYTLSEMDSTSRSSCVHTNYDRLAPKSLKEHNQKHKNHWDEIYELLGIGENNGNELEQNLPTVPVLYGNYPNPFNPETTISFSIPEESKVELTVYNIKGQKIKTIAMDVFEKGFHKLIWNGKDSSGKEVASGIYFYKLKVNGKDKSVRKCLLLK